MTERQLRISMEVRERTGIDEAMIDRVVRTFYAKVREDEVLGPVFKRPAVGLTSAVSTQTHSGGGIRGDNPA